MKKILVLVLATALVGGAALAVWNAQDVVPAATLLVPYAVVSSTPDGLLTDPTGWSTLFAVTNVSSEAIIVHLTVWSARSSAVVDWDILLTGYDVWTINFRDMLDGNFGAFDTNAGARGTAPASHSWTPNAWGPVYNKLTLTAANGGLLPESDYWLGTEADLANCLMPYGPQTLFGEIIRSKIRTGQAKAPTMYYTCDANRKETNSTTLGALTNADPFFFYVTADVVVGCTKDFQNTYQYWQGNWNRDANVIIGDIIYLNETAHYSEMLNAVHLESYGPIIPTIPYLTFYELDMWDVNFGAGFATPDGRDTRESLGSQYAFRYATAPSPLQSNVIVWKSMNDLLTVSSVEYSDGCHSYRYYAWNEDELTKTRQGGGPSGSIDTLEQCALCFETQKIPVSLKNFPGLVNIATADKLGGAGFGWVWIDFVGSVAFNGSYIYEAYVAMEFVFGNYATAAAAPLLWTPFNRNANGSAVPAYLPIDTHVPYPLNRWILDAAKQNAVQQQ